MLERTGQLTEKLNEIYRPFFYHISNPGDKKAVDELLQSGNIFIHD